MWPDVKGRGIDRASIAQWHLNFILFIERVLIIPIALDPDGLEMTDPGISKRFRYYSGDKSSESYNVVKLFLNMLDA